MHPEITQILPIIEKAKTILVIQADNPDADSLASSLALEEILSDIGKQVFLYCSIDIPSYLRYLAGWDRVFKDLPTKFDASIIVDASTTTLFEGLVKLNKLNSILIKPLIILDHHEVTLNKIQPYSVLINDINSASTGELIYLIAKQLNFEINLNAKKMIAYSILGDTQGLSNNLATSKTYRIMADMIDSGLNRAELEETRRAYSKMPEEIYRFKGELIRRTNFSLNKKIAWLQLNEDELIKYSPLYNPAPLIQNDMLMTENIQVAIVFKKYGQARLTAAIRTNPKAPIAAKLAEKFGGGGHAFAAGFKIINPTSDKIVNQIISQAEKLISNENI